MNVLFVDTSNQDKAPAMAAFFALAFAAHAYRSKGVSQVYSAAPDYLVQADIDWANVIVFADDVHYEVAKLRFPSMAGSPLDPAGTTKVVYTLNIPDYYVYGASVVQQTAATQAYMTNAQLKLNKKLK
jgi:predicted protein tyrosine phosphatase